MEQIWVKVKVTRSTYVYPASALEQPTGRQPYVVGTCRVSYVNVTQKRKALEIKRSTLKVTRSQRMNTILKKLDGESHIVSAAETTSCYAPPVGKGATSGAFVRPSVCLSIRRLHSE